VFGEGAIAETFPEATIPPIIEVGGIYFGGKKYTIEFELVSPLGAVSSV